jgi:predicted phosphoribosyltransferase
MEGVRFVQGQGGADRRLAQRLSGYRDEGPVVLALPRGGVPVGYEISRTLGASGHEEFGVGTVALGGVRVLSDDEVVEFLERTRWEQDERGVTGPEART